jgi:hypothetical protein
LWSPVVAGWRHAVNGDLDAMSLLVAGMQFIDRHCPLVVTLSGKQLDASEFRR